MPHPRTLLVAALAAALAPLAACAAWQAEPATPTAPAVAGAQASAAHPSNSGHEMFLDKDRDGDGLLSQAELVLGLRPVPVAEARRMFTLLDRDRDGRVGVAEYYPDPASIQAFGFTEHRADHGE